MFAEYLAAKSVGEALPDPTTFRTLLQLLVSPSLPSLSRSILLNEITSTVIDCEPADRDDMAVTIAALFKLLGMQEAVELHSGIVQSDLPGVIGLESGEPRITAAEVFARNPEARQRAESILRSYTGAGTTLELQKWLSGPTRPHK